MLIDHHDDVNEDIATIARISAVPTILSVVCEMTGMRMAAVARVIDDRWIACAALDGLGLGVSAGTEVPLQTTLCLDSRASRRAIAVARASDDPIFRDHPAPKLQRAQSYVTAPIVLASGDYFGNLCALDPEPADISAPKFLSMFERFAALIATHIDAERRLAVAEASLVTEREASALRDEFTAILGHDLRNPLTAILSWVMVLEARATDSDLARVAGRIKASAKRMAVLVDDMLDLTRGRLGGGLSARLATVDNLDSVLDGVVAELSQAHPGRTVRRQVDTGIPVVCDASRIAQLASNLLANAMIHGDPSCDVGIAARVKERVLILEVWNAGAPLSAEAMSMIFKPFWRNAASRDRHGLGLGLYICDMIVESHGGTLSVESSAQAGTTFTARIPVVPTNAVS